MGKIWIACGALALAAAPVAAAQSLEQDVAANRHVLTLEDRGELGGAGAALLQREIAGAQFLMIGEQHATADIAEVSAALHRQAAAAGFDHSALEIGPHSARHVERLIRSGPGSLASFIRQPGNSFTIPFLFWAEEVELAEQIVRRSRASANVLWGLDHEFVGSGPILLERLDRLAHNDDQREALAALRQKAATEPMLIGSAVPSEFDRLAAAFPESTDAEAAAIIADIQLSNRIYGAFTRREGSVHAANSTREAYMKSNFVTAFQQTEAATGRPPRVFLKFGGNHAFRGFGMTNVPALGNFLAEWGHARGFRLLNIFIGCIGGEQSDPQTGAAGACDSSELPETSLLRPGSNDDRLVLYDLRPLRANVERVPDAATRRMILGFDFYLPVRNVRAATLVAPPSS